MGPLSFISSTLSHDILHYLIAFSKNKHIQFIQLSCNIIWKLFNYQLIYSFNVANQTNIQAYETKSFRHHSIMSKAVLSNSDLLSKKKSNPNQPDRSDLRTYCQKKSNPSLIKKKIKPEPTRLVRPSRPQTNPCMGGPGVMLEFELVKKQTRRIFGWPGTNRATQWYSVTRFGPFYGSQLFS